MGLLTRCPTCDTFFKVVPDQLRISEGWVKCGQCGDIFDGSQQLMAFDEEIAPSSESITVSASVEVLPELLPPLKVQETLSAVINPVDCTSAAAHQDISNDLGMSLPMSVPENGDTNLQAATHERKVIQTERSSEFTLEPPSHENAFVVQATYDAQAADPLHEIPQGVGFLNTNTAQQRPQTSLSLAAWAGLVLLVLLFAGQWTWASRHRLAATYPNSIPVWRSVAVYTGSTLKPLQQIDSLTVDSVSFHQVAVATYRLNFVVKNNADIALAQPWLELTLTDAQEQPVYRRVLSAKELRVENTTIEAKSQWVSGVTMNVEQAISSPALLGYKLLVFYP